MSEWIYGKLPVLEALRSQRRKVKKFFYLKQKNPEKSLLEAWDLLKEQKVQVSPQEKPWFEAKFPQAVTQGWVAEVEDFAYADFSALLQKCSQQSHACLLILDHIQDPHNLGAILRVAEGLGVDGILLPQDRAALVSPLVAKVSAGALEYLEIVRVTNLNRAIEALKKEGFWLVGAEAEGEEKLGEFSWPTKTAIVLGAEGKGLSRLVKESCDFLVSIPLLGQVTSLNVSVAAAIFLFDYQVKKMQS